MNKKLFRVMVCCLFSIIMVLLPVLAGCTGEKSSSGTQTVTATVTKTVTTTTAKSESNQTFIYRLATGSPEMKNPVTEEMKEWAANVAKATNGRLKIEIYWGGTLGESKDALNMLDSGIADMVMEGYGYFSDTFPISEVITLPYLVTSTVECGTLMNGLLYDGLLPEYDRIKLLMFKPQDPIMLFVRDKKVTKIEDLKGLKIRTNTQGATKLVEKLGGVPVSVATPDLYTSLETGVIDGLVTSLGFFYPMKMYEVCKYAVVEPIAMSMTFIAMSWDAWNRLPADLQRILEEVTWDYYWTNINHETDRYLNSYLKPVKDAGVELIYLSDQERARWEQATQSLIDEWITKMDGKGLAGSEAVRRARVLKEVLR